MNGIDIKMKKKLGILLFALLLFSIQSTTFAADSNLSDDSPVNIHKLSDAKMVSSQEESIIRNELGLNNVVLNDEEKIALLSTGSGTIWNQTYKNKYNIKKAFAMTASLVSKSTKPYTKITISNTGKTEITAIAYKGSVLGSNTICSAKIKPGKIGTITISKKNIIKYGTINGQGTSATLGYTVSLYNANAKAFSCKVKAVRYK